MRLLQTLANDEIRLTEDFSADAIPPYAILSHRWGKDDEEVTFEDIEAGRGQEKAGYEKIRFCSKQALTDRLKYFWVDSCCINKRNGSELSQALRSMFRWYRHATRCYVYLSDVSMKESRRIDEETENTLDQDFLHSEWHNRGWTLQELLAPRSVEFFSHEGHRLGDRTSLRQQLQRLTGIPISALEGRDLSNFTRGERFLWIEHRKTKLEEDKAYALMGIFGVSINPLYGEGAASAFRRLSEEIDKWEQCIQSLHCTDPRKDKKRIEEAKDGLLKESYKWILENHDFQRWRDEQGSRLLWIKGDPGKGKTMLLCGIIDELERPPSSPPHLVSHFFCQATDTRINNATAVLRGLIYLLITKQPSLSSHIERQLSYTGQKLFEDANSWIITSEILADILQDPDLPTTYLLVDALDECLLGLPGLLDFIVRLSSLSPRTRWLVSSRNWPSIEERLEQAPVKARLSLELNAASVSLAVSTYVEHKVNEIVREKNLNDDTRNAVFDYLSSNANNTFLWVALVFQNLRGVRPWNIVNKLRSFPPGLNALYKRMMDQINESDDADICKRFLALSVLVFRPVTIQEIACLANVPKDIAENPQWLADAISLCGSFLTIRDDTIYLVHQSAKDHLLNEVSQTLFAQGKEAAHYRLFCRSLRALSGILRRDIYRIGAPGCLIEDVKFPSPDPLVTCRYSIVHWVDHLIEWKCHPSINHNDSSESLRVLETFMSKHYLYWLEALSLLKSTNGGSAAMANLETFFETMMDCSELLKTITDARRFLLSFKIAIQASPLQVYVSALLFSPRGSIIRHNYKEEVPRWFTSHPEMDDTWSSRVQVLETQSSITTCLTFSYDGTRIVCGSYDGTVNLWDVKSGAALATLRGHHRPITSISVSTDDSQIASLCKDGILRRWNTESGTAISIENVPHRGDDIYVDSSAISPDGKRVAYYNVFGDVALWEVDSAALQTIMTTSQGVRGLSLSPDSRWLLCKAYDKVVVWDSETKEVAIELSRSGAYVACAFSPDSKKIAFSTGETVEMWDLAMRTCTETIGRSMGCIHDLAFSPDGKRLLGSRGVTLSDVESETEVAVLGTLPDDLVFSPDGRWLASFSVAWLNIEVWDAKFSAAPDVSENYGGPIGKLLLSTRRLISLSTTWHVRAWDVESGLPLPTVHSHDNFESTISLSPSGKHLALKTESFDVSVFDEESGSVVGLLKGYDSDIVSVAFSPDSKLLISSSSDTIWIWNVMTSQAVVTLHTPDREQAPVVFSPDARLFASRRIPSTLEIWDIELRTIVATLRSSVDEPWCGFSPDSKRIAYVTERGVLELWDTESGKAVVISDFRSEWDIQNPMITFSPDSKKLALRQDVDIHLKIAESGAMAAVCRGHLSVVRAITFSPDSKYLASASKDGTVKLWSAESGTELAAVDFYLLQPSSEFRFSPEGSQLITRQGNISVQSHGGDFEYALALTGLSIDDDWITMNSQRIMWLPVNYRHNKFLVHGERIYIGYQSGRVSIFRFDFSRMEFLR